jgi:hypothetical protein
MYDTNGRPVNSRPAKRFGQRYTPYRASAASSQASMGTRVYVGNLSWEASWQDLKDHMRGTSQDLNVIYTDIMTEPNGGA